MTGRITSLSITDSGFGYTTAPSVTISVPDQDSANATATASINGAGNLSAITLTDSGTYYISPPTVTISSPPGGVVTSASVVATGVAHVNGQNYNTTGGSGTGFIIRATSSGGLTSFTIIDGGKNYVAGDQVLTDNSPYEATIRIDSVGANTLATATAVVDSSTGGRISAINLVIVGTGYDSVPTVTIDSANGTAHDYRATATATLGDSGKIASLSITDSGAGYITAPTVTLEAAPRIVKDSASQTLSTGVKVSGEILKYSDSDGKIYIGRTVADDGNYHEFVKDRQITLASINDGSPISRNVIATSNDDIQSTKTEQNLDFDTVSGDFLDFSETNPFGDPED